MCREITYYTCTALMFLFGLKMIWEAWRMGVDEAEETRREVEEELGVADTNRLIAAIIIRLDLVSFVDFKRTRQSSSGFN